MKPLWIDFEGIDGSGKTTVSTRVAEALRARGVAVVHAREGGRFASPIAGKVRDLARSRECLRLAPEAELLLNLAREAQLTAEVIRPALAQGAWVITDRTAYSHLGLARSVRGLAGPEAEAAARMALQGLVPDRVFLIDVDPDVARWRRRIRKVREGRPDEGGRKGLAGDSLALRTREAFLGQAAAEGWPVLENTWRSLDETVAAVLACLDGHSAPAPAVAPFEADPDSLVEGFLAFAGSVKDRGLGAMLAAGLDDPRADAVRRAAPADVAAYAVTGMDAPAAWALREDLLEESPHQVARSLAGLRGSRRAWDLRRRLEPAAPGEVLQSLAGEGGGEAHALRRRQREHHEDDVLRSLRLVRDEDSWEFRRSAPRNAALAESVTGLDVPEAWEIRGELGEREPLAVLRSLRGLDRPEAWDLRGRLAGVAPKTVLASIEGMGGAEADALRDRLAPAAPEETAASLAGLDTPEAWRRREALSDAAPAGVIKSLKRIESGRAEALAARLVAAHPRRLRVARGAVQFKLRAAWTGISI
jgi:dTMP kinase